MKKLMKKEYDVKMIMMIILIAVMSSAGVYYMEEEWTEWMTGVIWLIGELLIVGVLTFKPIVRFILKETEPVFKKMLED